MGQVLSMKPRDRSQLLERALDIVNRIRNGELDGMMDVLSRTDGKQESGIAGVFTTDSDFAVKSAKEGFNCLLEHRACLKDHEQLPRRLRPEVKNENLCSAVSCIGRR